MHRGRAATIGRTAQLVLLACTLLGLAAMHTIGHNAAGHGAHSHHTADHQSIGAGRLMVVIARHTVSPAAAFVEPDGCAGDGCTRAAMSGAADNGMGGWELCVAVLSTSSVALLLAALLLAAVTGGFPALWRRGRGITAPRGPPVLPYGLRLASVSVLRT